jgi:transcriptional regulator with XRE-family HTH domain
MTPKTARELGSYLRGIRQERGLTVREVGHRAGLRDSTVLRLEQGIVSAPHVDTLRAISQVLNLPPGDVLSRAGYVSEDDLPTLAPYLRTKYRRLPKSAVVEIEASFRRIAARHGYDPGGPAPGEDE